MLVDTEKKVRLLKLSGSTINAGLFIFDKAFARGVNVKLMIPAQVCVVVNNRKVFDKSTVT